MAASNPATPQGRSMMKDHLKQDKKILKERIKLEKKDLKNNIAHAHDHAKGIQSNKSSIAKFSKQLKSKGSNSGK